MELYQILGFEREPFSNSPDPDLFFQSRRHQECLQKLEIAVRLRRGLNVVIGDIGTGKTTICRRLIRQFAGDKRTETHLIFDPSFASPVEALKTIAGLFGLSAGLENPDVQTLKEKVRSYLFFKGVDAEVAVVLIIDEGQKMPDFFMEILRELLNYETNTCKLLQIVIFAQPEYESALEAHANFTDRINLFYRLTPLGFGEMRDMILYRLRGAGFKGGAHLLLPRSAMREIYRITRGYPRRVMTLCHQSMVMMVIQNRDNIDRRLVRTCGWQVGQRQGFVRREHIAAALMLLLIVAGAFFFGSEITYRKAVKATEIAASSPPTPGTRSPEKASELDVPPSAVVSPAPETEVAKPETPKPAADVEPDMPIHVSYPPEILGAVAIQRGETVSGMVRRIYGRVSPESLQAVKAANPELPSFRRIRVGDLIRFPTIPVPQNAKAGFWLELGRSDILADAFEMARNYEGPGVDPVIIAQWRPRGGLLFSVAVNRLFDDADQARVYGDALGGALAGVDAPPTAVTVSDPSTVLFTRLD